MARQRIGGNNNSKKNDSEEEKILATLKDRPKATTGLFRDMDVIAPSGKLSLQERDYYTVAYMLRKRYQGDKVDGSNLESIKVIANFFKEHYKNVTGANCIDYNWYHFLKVMQDVMTYFQFSDFIDLADFICRSLIRFEQVSKKLNLSERKLTLSTYRQTWILDELDKPQSHKFEGFY